MTKAAKEQAAADHARIESLREQMWVNFEAAARRRAGGTSDGK